MDAQTGQLVPNPGVYMFVHPEFTGSLGGPLAMVQADVLAQLTVDSVPPPGYGRLRVLLIRADDPASPDQSAFPDWRHSGIVLGETAISCLSPLSTDHPGNKYGNDSSEDTGSLRGPICHTKNTPS